MGKEGRKTKGKVISKGSGGMAMAGLREEMRKKQERKDLLQTATYLATEMVGFQRPIPRKGIKADPEWEELLAKLVDTLKKLSPEDRWGEINYLQREVIAGKRMASVLWNVVHALAKIDPEQGQRFFNAAKLTTTFRTIYEAIPPQVRKQREIYPVVGKRMAVRLHKAAVSCHLFEVARTFFDRLPRSWKPELEAELTKETEAPTKTSTKASTEAPD